MLCGIHVYIRPEDIDYKQFIKNPYWCCEEYCSVNTGEVRVIQSKASNCIFTVKVSPNAKKQIIKIRGSLYLFYQYLEGAIHAKEFNWKTLIETLRVFVDAIGVAPSKIFIEKLEVGWNVIPKLSSKLILQRIMMYSTVSFNKRLAYKEFNRDKDRLKFYLKNEIEEFKNRLHLPVNTLRVEKCYDGSKLRKEFNLETIEGLYNEGLYFELHKDLLKTWNEGVLFFDPTIILPDNHTRTDKDFYLNAQNPIYWEGLIDAKKEAMKLKKKALEDKRKDVFDRESKKYMSLDQKIKRQRKRLRKWGVCFGENTNFHITDLMEKSFAAFVPIFRHY